MIYKYTPYGVCSREMEVTINDDGIIEDVKIIGGCDGNLKGIIKLVTGRNIDEVIELLEGIECRDKGTSCPDQLAQCLKEASELL